MKKRFIAVMCAMFCVLMFAMPVMANAATSGDTASSNSIAPKIVYQANEIKDLDQLWQRAINNETDIPRIPFKDNVSLNGAPTSYISDLKQTTQKLEEIQNTDGTTATSYATTTFALANPNTSTSGSKNWNLYDGSLTIQHIGTVYYTETTDVSGGASQDWVNVTGYYCRWQRAQDSQITTENSYYALWYYGSNGNNFVGSHTNNYVPPTWGYTYYTAPSFGGLGKGINVQPYGCYIVAKQEDTVCRSSGSQWDFTSEYEWGSGGI